MTCSAPVSRYRQFFVKKGSKPAAAYYTQQSVYRVRTGRYSPPVFGLTQKGDTLRTHSLRRAKRLSQPQADLVATRGSGRFLGEKIELMHTMAIASAPVVITSMRWPGMISIIARIPMMEATTK